MNSSEFNKIIAELLGRPRSKIVSTYLFIIKDFYSKSMDINLWVQFTIVYSPKDASLRMYAPIVQTHKYQCFEQIFMKF